MFLIPRVHSAAMSLLVFNKANGGNLEAVISVQCRRRWTLGEKIG